jgi:protein-S-isoprenylcysteine O-methyltransferase Ste14
MKTTQMMPTSWLLIAILSMLAVHIFLPTAIFIPAPWHLLGFLPLAIGIMINLIADRAFHETATTVKPFEESSVLITDGIFRFSRNPMYLGFILMLTGIAFLLRSLFPFIIIPAFAMLITRTYITEEERMLENAFGPQWSAYKRNTRRWL